MDNKIIKLSNCEVEIVPHITWGQKEQIQAIINRGVIVGHSGMDGFNTDYLLEAKYKALEICVVKVIQDGEEKPFTCDWMNSLSPEDGDTLYEAVNAVTEPKKNFPSSN